MSRVATANRCNDRLEAGDRKMAVFCSRQRGHVGPHGHGALTWATRAGGRRPARAAAPPPPSPHAG